MAGHGRAAPSHRGGRSRSSPASWTARRSPTRASTSARRARASTCVPSGGPPVYLSAFHEQAAELAGRLCDGVWTLGDPTSAPGVLAAYRRGCEDAGRQPGEIILQSLASVAATDEEALESSREWKASLADELYTDDIHVPADIQAKGDDVSDRTFTTGNLVSADPDTHVRKLKLMGELGATAIVLVNASGADPARMIDMYGASVLPQLRDDLRGRRRWSYRRS